MKRSSIFAFLFFGSSIAVASPLDHFFVGGEGGYSLSNSVALNPVSNAPCTTTTACWTNPNQNFGNSMRNSGLYGAVAGVRFNHFVMMDLLYDVRNNFNWNKTFPASAVGFPQTVHRSVNIRDQTLMLNLALTPNLQWEKLDPFINFGIGTAWNTTGNLRNTNVTTGSVSFISGNRTSSLAWQAGAGLNYNATSHIMFDAGYRFVSMGKIETGNQVLSPMVQPISALKATSSYLNEIYAGINFFL